MSFEFRSVLHRLRYTPIHPQWFAYRYERRKHEYVGRLSSGRILDIGCGRQTVRKYFKASHTYYGLDSLETGLPLYNTIPSIFGDAVHLPFPDETFDTVILLEVLEHLNDPIRAMQEARRVLKLDGILIISTPFLYPIHDAPRDFQRWTQFGIKFISDSSGFAVQELQTIGSPIETGTLLFNLSIAWTVINAPFLVRLPFFLISGVVIPLFNILGYTISLLCNKSKTTPFAIGYLLVAGKPDR
jgi:SAM-dependent methyltransferase